VSYSESTQKTDLEKVSLSSVSYLSFSVEIYLGYPSRKFSKKNQTVPKLVSSVQNTSKRFKMLLKSRILGKKRIKY
jgi:hypothetical protein